MRLDTKKAREALAVLRTFDHAIVDMEGVNVVREGFGLPRLERGETFKDGEGDGKNRVTLNGDQKTMEGMGGHDLALAVCSELRVPCAEKHGRGSQLWACVEALQGFLDREK